MIIAVLLAVLQQAPLPMEPQPWFMAPETSCNEEGLGDRRAVRCTLIHNGPGQTWDIASDRALSFSISKPTGSTGTDVVHVWVDRAPIGSYEIHAGEERQITLQGSGASADAKVVVETREVGGEGSSTSSVRFEWLKN